MKNGNILFVSEDKTLLKDITQLLSSTHLNFEVSKESELKKVLPVFAFDFVVLDLDNPLLDSTLRLLTNAQSTILLIGSRLNFLQISKISAQVTIEGFLKKESIQTLVQVIVNSQQDLQLNESFIDVVSDGEKQRLNRSQICHLRADKGYVYVNLCHGKDILVRISFKEMIEQLPNMVQIHKSYAVNRMKISAITNTEITINGITKFPIGRAYKQALKGLLDF